jgi:hypothetical protein
MREPWVARLGKETAKVTQFRYWPLADMATGVTEVRFGPRNGHARVRLSLSLFLSFRPASVITSGARPTSNLRRRVRPRAAIRVNSEHLCLPRLQRVATPAVSK